MTENTELSEREVEILRLVATGASNKEIAQKLYISANTVKVHLRNIFSKIGATTRTEAAMFAVQTGLVPTGAGGVDGGESGSAADLAAPEQAGESPETAARQSQTAQTAQGVGPALLPWAGAAVIVVLVLILWILSGRDGVASPAATAAVPTEAPRWQEHAPLTTPRFGLALAVFENRIYAVGGEAAGGVTGVVEIYDPQADAWEDRQEKPLPSADISAGVIAGKIYIPGGRLADGSVSERLEIYDPALDEWTRGADLPAPRSAYALVVFEGKLYLFGGWEGKTFTASSFRYDPEQDRWETLQPMSVARGFAGAAVAAGKIFVLGGSDGRAFLDVNEVYRPGREGSRLPAWSRAAALPAGRSAMGIASVVDVLYLVGGETPPETEAQPLAFYPELDEWQEFQQPEVLSWSHMGVVLLGPQLYVVGGRVDKQPSDQNLAYKAIFTVSIPTIIKDQ